MRIFLWITTLSLVTTLSAEHNISRLYQEYAKPISEWVKPTIDKGVEYKEMESIKESHEKKSDLVKLGIRFFNEPRFSSSMTLSCATCHTQNKGYAEHTKVSTGHNGLKGGRNSPTLYGAMEGKHFFWDGGAASLEEQALGPIANPVEMAMPIEELKKRLKTMSGYEKDLEKVFGDAKLNIERVTSAIAAYERTIKPPRTAYDEFLDGDSTALNEKELLGLHLFRTKARCMNCHSGKYLTDGEFHNLGLTYYGRDKHEDFGRYNISNDNNTTGKFKTPTLRQISNTYPYMHNGLFAHLKGVINMYNGGMPNIVAKTQEQKEDLRFPRKSKHLKKLKLSKKEKIALEAFLRVL